MSARDWGDFRKLYTQLPPSFERLPFSVRSMSAEIIRRCDRRGRIIPCSDCDARDALVNDLAFHVRAHASDSAFIRAGLDALLEDGYLVFSNGWLTIRNFREAQETESAKRMRAKRERDGCDAQSEHISQPTTASPGLVSSGLVSSDPDPDPKDRSDLPDRLPQRDREQAVGPIPCPPDLRLTDDQVATIQVSLDVPDWGLDTLTKQFILNAQGDPFDYRPLGAWRKCLAKMIVATWQDSSKRPKEPPPSEDEKRAANRRKREWEQREAEAAQARLAAQATPEDVERFKSEIGDAWK